MTLVSLWNQLANLAYPIVALFLLTMVGEETAVLATAAFVGVAILGVVVGCARARPLQQPHGRGDR